MIIMAKVTTIATAFAAGAILSAFVTVKAMRRKMRKSRKRLVQEARSAHQTIMDQQYRSAHAWHHIGG